MTTLVTFGDSWPYGTELLPGQKTYGEILAESLDLPFENHSRPATSNDHMILQVQKFIKSRPSVDGDVAVFFITSPSRTCVIDYNGSALEIIPWNDKSKGDRSHAYFKYFHTPQQEEFRLHICLLALQRICQEYKIKDHYIVGWSKINFDFPGIDLNKIYQQGQITCADLFEAPGDHEFTQARNNRYVYPNDCHPNQMGHQLIAKKLAEWINN